MASRLFGRVAAGITVATIVAVLASMLPSHSKHIDDDKIKALATDSAAKAGQ